MFDYCSQAKGNNFALDTCHKNMAMKNERKANMGIGTNVADAEKRIKEVTLYERPK